MSEIYSTKKIFEEFRNIIPKIDKSNIKGDMGRVGIVGGTSVYTGSPYFAGITALRAGADKVHIFCFGEAPIALRSYSPDLLVHSLSNHLTGPIMVERITRDVDVLVIGAGIDKDVNTLLKVKYIIQACKVRNIPIILTSEGLTVIEVNWDIFQDYDSKVILVCSAKELQILVGMGSPEYNISCLKSIGVTCLVKGKQDIIYPKNIPESISCDIIGSGRRCEGQGSLLAGALGLFFYWALKYNSSQPAITACVAASKLIRHCNCCAFTKFGRSMMTSDILKELPFVFYQFYEP